ncbi:MAG TPA: septum formation initiator family protein [Candidatus Saccharimonadales bacterium]|nr:septum formation initiator family protein [Candidatus Saccharimonadales bacterium]
MREKIKHYQTKLLVPAAQLRDVRVVGVLCFLLVLILISWSGVKAIDTNYGLQKQIAQLQQQNTVAQLTNTNLSLQNKYYNTPQYLELAARQDFGLAAPGETVLIVPHSVAMAHTVLLPQDDPAKNTTKASSQPFYQRNVNAWLDFLFHRRPAND